MAGTLAEIARHTLRGEFRHYDPRNARVVLIEGGERVLPGYPPDLSEKARLQLERLGVSVWLGHLVSGVDADGVQVGDERLAAKTVVWAAGVAASPLGATLGAPLDRAGRVIVEPDLSLARPPRDLGDRRPRRPALAFAAGARHRPAREADGPPRREEHPPSPARQADEAHSATATTARSRPSAAARPSPCSAA